MPVASEMLRAALHDPERLAIAGESERLSYAELVGGAGYAHAAAAALHRSQASPPTPAPETEGGRITAVSLDSAFECARLVAQLSGFAGVVAVIDPRWPLEHRVRVVLTTGIGVVISDDPELASALATRGWGGTAVTRERFLALESGLRIAAAGRQELQESEHFAARDDGEPFLLLFSSGTTSAPKAFLKRRRQYRVSTAVSGPALGPVAGRRTYAPGPVSYSLTLYAVVECLAWGGSVVLDDRFDPFRLAERMRAERIERVVAVPAVAQAIARVAKRSPEATAQLSQIVVGGANLPHSIRADVAAALPGVDLVSYYGAAEIGFIGFSRGPDDADLKLFHGVEVEVREPSGAATAAGDLGELWVRAGTCSDGYLAGTTAETLLGDDRWATVHDMARYEHGTLRLAGRAGDVAVTGGHKVALPEIDRAFDGHPTLDAFAAVALPHEKLGHVLGFVVERAANEAADTVIAAGELRDALSAWAKPRLAPQFVPQRWFAVERLPRTVGGKIRRGEVAALVERGEAVRL